MCIGDCLYYSIWNRSHIFVQAAHDIELAFVTPKHINKMPFPYPLERRVCKIKIKKMINARDIMIRQSHKLEALRCVAFPVCRSKR
jgi:hypothetical protein